jgi:hypothetical protein
VLAGCFFVAGSGITAGHAKTGDTVKSLEAFKVVQGVVTGSRCMNCHTVVGWPTQGDDQHRHTFNVMRGPDGRGAAGLRCATCHLDRNMDAANVPGAKDWHMAPVSMGWTGLTPRALCLALLDTSRNGGKSGEQLLEHLRSDPLVLWAWAPGGKRKPPEVSHAAFMKAAEAWVGSGAAGPAS